MIRATKTLAALAVALLLAPALPAAAEELTGEFSGSFRVGFRSVDVGGAEHKYREDYDLEDGPRLFDFRLRFVPEEGARGMADEFTLDLTNFGGDPFETLSLAVRKFDRYDFRYDRRKSSYFYEDVILPHELASVSLSSGGDFHHFDFERVRDSARLGLDLTRAAKLHFGFERFTKRGESTTTLDLSRDEFEFHRPIDESLNEYVAGFEYAWDKATLVLEERVRDYENLVEIFLPGFSLGENPTNGTTLDFFFLDQPYDFTSNEHTVRFVARPNRKFNLAAAASVQDLSLDVTATEESQGTAFNGAPFTTDLAGSGDIDRDAELVDVDLSYWISDRVAVVGSAWYRSLDQQGSFTFGGSLNEGEWDIETTGVKAGVQVHVSPKVVVAGGVSTESRDVTFGHEEGSAGGPLPLEEESTDRTGYFATVAWNPTKAFRLTAEAEDNSYDDPFTLISATEHQRFRVRGRYTLAGGMSFSGSYLAHRFDNDDSGWQSDRDQFDLRLAYRKGDLSFSLGYAFVDVEQGIDQLVSTGQLFPIFYQIDSDFIDGHARWQATERFAVGGDIVFYDNGGSFGLARDDLRGYVEVGLLTDYRVRLGYRTIDYDEDAFDFDDYDADIVELSIGYGW